MKRWILFGSVLACLSICGCGSDGPEIIPVEGTASLGGGQWPKGGTLTFAPVQAQGENPRLPGWAEFDASGRFSARCSHGEGLVPGTYRVHIQCDKVEHEHGEGSPENSFVARSYAQQPHEIEIAAGMAPLTLDFPKN